MKILAATRLASMTAHLVPRDQRPKLIQRMKDTCKCDEKTAKHYLESEEWLLSEAVDSYKADKAHGLHAKQVQAADDNGDSERLDQLKTQIRDLEIDVKEIEDDGDDATVERKHLEKLRDEQRRLKEKMGIKVGAAARLKAAGMSNADLMKRMLESASRLMDWGMNDMGWSYEEALKHAKEKSTAGPAVWKEIEKKYGGRK